MKIILIPSPINEIFIKPLEENSEKIIITNIEKKRIHSVFL